MSRWLYLLQWGHGDEAVEELGIVYKPVRGIVLQWGHGDEAVEESGVSSRSWSSSRLQWGHGDEAVEEGLSWVEFRLTCTGFNGATAMKPWKSALPALLALLESLLQWGHGDEAVEEIHDRRSIGRRKELASMGPRR